MEKHHGQLAVLREAVLHRCGIHSAAVKSAVHSGRYPYLFVSVSYPVNRYRCTAGLVCVKQTLYCYHSVVYGLVGFLLKLVTNLTAVPVNSKAHSVDKEMGSAVYGNLGQIAKVFVYPYRLVTPLGAYIVEEIVSAAVGEEINIVRVFYIAS